MKSVAFLDYLVVVGYLFAIAAFGGSFYRRKTTAEEYFIGGRSMSWLPAGISIIAADLGAITIMGAPAWNYKRNLELVWSAVGYPLIGVAGHLCLGPFLLEAEALHRLRVSGETVQPQRAAADQPAVSHLARHARGVGDLRALSGDQLGDRAAGMGTHPVYGLPHNFSTRLWVA